MKFRLTIFTLVFAMMLPSTTFAEWTRVVSAEDGTEHYVDFERIRNHSGYVHYWALINLPTQSEEREYSSNVNYWRADCRFFRVKCISAWWYEGQMGRGGIVFKLDEEEENWTYPPPNTAQEVILKDVCAR